MQSNGSIFLLLKGEKKEFASIGIWMLLEVDLKLSLTAHMYCFVSVWFLGRPMGYMSFRDVGKLIFPTTSKAQSTLRQLSCKTAVFVHHFHGRYIGMVFVCANTFW